MSANAQRTNSRGNKTSVKNLRKETVYVWVLQGREVGLVGLEGPCRSPDGLGHSLLKVLLLMSAPLSTLNKSQQQSTAAHINPHRDTAKTCIEMQHTCTHRNKTQTRRKHTRYRAKQTFISSFLHLLDTFFLWVGC